MSLGKGSIIVILSRSMLQEKGRRIQQEPPNNKTEGSNEIITVSLDLKNFLQEVEALGIEIAP